MLVSRRPAIAVVSSLCIPRSPRMINRIGPLLLSRTKTITTSFTQLMTAGTRTPNHGGSTTSFLAGSFKGCGCCSGSQPGDVSVCESPPERRALSQYSKSKRGYGGGQSEASVGGAFRHQAPPQHPVPATSALGGAASSPLPAYAAAADTKEEQQSSPGRAQVHIVADAHSGALASPRMQGTGHSDSPHNGQRGHALKAHTHSHAHEHSDGHRHHHFHANPDKPNNLVESVLSKMGLVQVANQLEASPRVQLLSIVCFVMATVMKLPFLASALPAMWAANLHNAFLAGTLTLSGIPNMVDCLVTAAAGRIDTHVLMSLAVLGTVSLGLVHEAALLLLLFQISHFLEEKFTARARGSLDQLLANIPDKATTVDLDPKTGGPMLSSARACLAENVRAGQLVLVKVGEQVPLDGKIAWGTANVSMQHISGESQPVRMVVGSDVPAGSVSTDGLLVVKVTATSEDSTPARIARLAFEAQDAKPHLERMLDRIGGLWSKAVIGATAATMVALPLMGVPLFDPHGAFYRAMGVLTAGSPCAVVLVPLAYVCAIATITRKGVLVKSADSLDNLDACKYYLLDKTGTITSGALTLTQARLFTAGSATAYEPQVLYTRAQGEGKSAGSIGSSTASSASIAGSTASVSSSDSASSVVGVDEEAVAIVEDQDHDLSSTALHYAVALSRASNHPVSRALVEFGAREYGEGVQVTQFEQVAGSGVQGVCLLPPYGPMMVKFGSLEFVQDSVSDPRLMAQLEAGIHSQQQLSSKALAFLTALPVGKGVAAQQQQQVAMLCFEDMIKPGVREAVQFLRQQGKKVLMITGDNRSVAQSVAGAVGLEADEFRAETSPEQKLQFVQEYSSSHADGVMMMGDGINDAPALAGARVGVAVASSPSDMVAAASDIIVLNGQGVANLPWLMQISSKTQQVVKQNMALALVSMFFATVPTLAGVFPLWLAVLLHEGSTLLVALNSLRMLADPQQQTLHGTMSSVLAAARDLGRDLMAAEDHHHGHGHSHGHSHGPGRSCCGPRTCSTQQSSWPSKGSVDCCKSRDESPCCGGHDHDHDHDHHHKHEHEHGKCCDHNHNHDHDHKQGHGQCGGKDKVE